MVSWIWIPVSVVAGAAFGFLLAALFVAADGSERR